MNGDFTRADWERNGVKLTAAEPEQPTRNDIPVASSDTAMHELARGRNGDVADAYAAFRRNCSQYWSMTAMSRETAYAWFLAGWRAK